MRTVLATVSIIERQAFASREAFTAHMTALIDVAYERHPGITLEVDLDRASSAWVISTRCDIGPGPHEPLTT